MTSKTLILPREYTPQTLTSPTCSTRQKHQEVSRCRACNFFSYCDLCWEDHQWVSCCQEACFSYFGGKLNSFYPSNSDVFRMFFMSSIFHGNLGSVSSVRLEKREDEYLLASFQKWWSTIWWPCSKTLNHHQHQQQFWPRKLIIVPVKSDFFETTKNMGL